MVRTTIAVSRVLLHCAPLLFLISQLVTGSMSLFFGSIAKKARNEQTPQTYPPEFPQNIGRFPRDGEHRPSIRFGRRRLHAVPRLRRGRRATATLTCMTSPRSVMSRSMAKG